MSIKRSEKKKKNIRIHFTTITLHCIAGLTVENKIKQYLFIRDSIRKHKRDIQIFLFDFFIFLFIKTYIYILF